MPPVLAAFAILLFSVAYTIAKLKRLDFAEHEENISGCGIYRQPPLLISYGLDAREGQFPWAVSILRYNGSTNS
ncbi:unnamed protein product [Toxocara canis]|uniref:Secreted protein n=1 Tax=Toxocara canis TaxID=6265 RepID=A0A183U2C0_TOXCA|nr:unnamed protein product [Toxocara canis]